MKAAGVLAFFILAVLITQVEVLTCKTTEDYNPVEIIFTEAECSSSQKCARPFFNDYEGEAYGYFGNEDWGCASDCATGWCVLCGENNCNVEALSCIKSTTSGAGTSERCGDYTVGTTNTYAAVVKCKRPKMDYDGYADDVTFGCGGCDPDNDNMDNCLDCSDGNDCNKMAGKTHNCMTYKWTDDKFVADATAVECNRGDIEEILCNKPSKDAEEEDYSDDGCGPCSGESCIQCTGESCNVIEEQEQEQEQEQEEEEVSSATKPMLFIVPFVLFVYNLF